MLKKKSQEYDDESKRLGRLFHSGDRQAGLDLLNLHLPLAYSIAERYANIDFDKDNTRQNARIGLWTAITLYDPERENTFSTYAVHWILQLILRGLRRQGPVRIPQHVVTALNRINRIASTFGNVNGTKMQQDEIAEQAGITVEEVDSLYSYEKSMKCAGHVSLDNPVQRSSLNDSDGGLRAAYSEGRGIARRVLKSGVLVYILSKKEIEILAARYGLFGHDEMTYREIAVIYGFSRHKAQHIERIALRKLHEHIVRSASNREEQRL